MKKNLIVLTLAIAGLFAINTDHAMGSRLPSFGWSSVLPRWQMPSLQELSDRREQARQDRAELDSVLSKRAAQAWQSRPRSRQEAVQAMQSIRQQIPTAARQARASLYQSYLPVRERVLNYIPPAENVRGYLWRGKSALRDYRDRAASALSEQAYPAFEGLTRGVQYLGSYFPPRIFPSGYSAVVPKKLEPQKEDLDAQVQDWLLRTDEQRARELLEGDPDAQIREALWKSAAQE